MNKHAINSNGVDTEDVEIPVKSANSSHERIVKLPTNIATTTHATRRISESSSQESTGSSRESKTTRRSYDDQNSNTKQNGTAPRGRTNASQEQSTTSKATTTPKSTTEPATEIPVTVTPTEHSSTKLPSYRDLVRRKKSDKPRPKTTDAEKLEEANYPEFFMDLIKTKGNIGPGMS